MIIKMEEKFYLKINESPDNSGANNSELEIKNANETQDFILEKHMEEKKQVHLLVLINM